MKVRRGHVFLVAGVSVFTVATLAMVVPRYGWSRFWEWTLFAGMVVQPFVSAGMLVFLVPGKPRGLLPAISTSIGVGAATVLAQMGWAGLFLVAMAQVIVVPATFIGGLVAWTYGRHRKQEEFRGFARALFAMALFLGVLPMAVPISNRIHRWEVERAKNFVESLALEVKQEAEKEGRLPTEVMHLMPRIGEPPSLVAGEGGLEYETDTGNFLLGFTSPTFMGIEGWQFNAGEGTWRHWVD